MTLLAFSFIGFLKGLIMFLFMFSAAILILIVLLQEPKGGGLSSAFGGAGADTFGDKLGAPPAKTAPADEGDASDTGTGTVETPKGDGKTEDE